jgi:hypothetical protein
MPITLACLTTLPMDNREFWTVMRQALLLMIDAIERMLEIEPRTAELRKMLR